jgi:hypothetical protein
MPLISKNLSTLESLQKNLLSSRLHLATAERIQSSYNSPSTSIQVEKLRAILDA